jgi:selenide,water dikinase
VKYGLSVTGVVHPDHILANNTGRAGDKLILTKKLGVGIICTANRVGEASDEAMEEAIRSMTTLNKYAAEILRRYPVHACTDVTGFSFLGHLHEMMDGAVSCWVDSSQVPIFKAAVKHADEFLLTAAGQRNRNYVGTAVHFEQVPFAMEEILFDPQTSGGLLAAVSPEAADEAMRELRAAGLPARIVGEIVERREPEIYVF